MARHSQPQELAKLKGSDKKNPQRYQKNPVKSQMPLGEAPDHMGDSEKANWFELESYAIPGVLTFADRVPFEMTVNLMTEMREDPRAFSGAKFGQLVGLLARFGMTPADRQKLSIDKDKDDDDDFGLL